MAFIIPDNDVAAFLDQSRWFQTDIGVLVAGQGGVGVKTGCAVTAQGSPDMTVAVASGTIYVDAAGTEASVTSGNLTITTAHSTNPRLDLISASAAGTKTVTDGTAAADPKPPALPSGHVALAFVYVPAADTDIDSNQIIDKRVILRDPGGGGSGATRLGKTTVGASFQASAGDSSVFMKKLTMPSDGILFPPTSYWKAVSTQADVGFGSSFWLDDGGSGSASRPLRAIAGIGLTTSTRVINTVGSEFWLTPGGCPAIWVASGQIIWAVTACHYQSPYVQIAYDTGGADLTAIYSASTVMGETDGVEGNDLDSFTDSTRHFSIYCPFIPV